MLLKSYYLSVAFCSFVFAVASPPEKCSIEKKQLVSGERHKCEPPSTSDLSGDADGMGDVNAPAAAAAATAVAASTNTHNGQLSSKLLTSSRSCSCLLPTLPHQRGHRGIAAAVTPFLRAHSRCLCSTEQGSLTIVRKSSTKKSPPARYFRRGASIAITDDEALDDVDLNTENLPAVDTPDACDKAALR